MKQAQETFGGFCQRMKCSALWVTSNRMAPAHESVLPQDASSRPIDSALRLGALQRTTHQKKAKKISLLFEAKEFIYSPAEAENLCCPVAMLSNEKRRQVEE